MLQTMEIADHSGEETSQREVLVPLSCEMYKKVAVTFHDLHLGVIVGTSLGLWGSDDSITVALLYNGAPIEPRTFLLPCRIKLVNRRTYTIRR